MSDRELPQLFDLLYDVKTMEQVGRIARGEGDCSDATPEDLRYLFFKSVGIEIPECLKDINFPDTEMLDWIINKKPNPMIYLAPDAVITRDGIDSTWVLCIPHSWRSDIHYFGKSPRAAITKAMTNEERD